MVMFTGIARVVCQASRDKPHQQAVHKRSKQNPGLHLHRENKCTPTYCEERRGKDSICFQYVQQFSKCVE